MPARAWAHCAHQHVPRARLCSCRPGSPPTRRRRPVAAAGALGREMSANGGATAGGVHLHKDWGGACPRLWYYGRLLGSGRGSCRRRDRARGWSGRRSGTTCTCGARRRPPFARRGYAPPRKARTRTAAAVLTPAVLGRTPRSVPSSLEKVRAERGPATGVGWVCLELLEWRGVGGGLGEGVGGGVGGS